MYWNYFETIKEKGFLELTNSLRILFKKYKKLHFVIAGSYLPSDYQGSASILINELKSEYPEKVKILGEIKRVEEIYNILDIFCLPSYREGLPYSVLEAMFSGVPVITSNIRGCRELIINNYSGLLTKYRSSYELRRNIESLIENYELRNFLSKNARDYALKNHTADKVLNNHLK